MYFLTVLEHAVLLRDVHHGKLGNHVLLLCLRHFFPSTSFDNQQTLFSLKDAKNVI